jgi:hypothetical protein
MALRLRTQPVDAAAGPWMNGRQLDDGSWLVTLTWDELTTAAIIGVGRRIRAMREGLGDVVRENRDPLLRWGHEVHSSAGERAVSKLLGREWAGEDADRFKGSDVGQRIQVKQCDADDASLIVRPNAADNDFYVLVVRGPPELRVVGWIRARDAKRDEWVRDPHGRAPAWFVPASALTRFRA